MEIEGKEIENGDVVLIETTKGVKRVGFFKDHTKTLFGKNKGIFISELHPDNHGFWIQLTEIKERNIESITVLK